MRSEEREWAYLSKTLLAAPEYERIERDAVELLGRALNSRPVIAFVGAGASMAYGRISWRDTVLAMQRRVLDRANRADKAFANDKKNWEKSKKILESTKLKPGSTWDSKDFLVAFQLTEELWRLLPKILPGDPESDFRQQVMDLLRDDHGHAEQIINYALRERADGSLNPRKVERISLKASTKQSPDINEDFRRFGYLETVHNNVLKRVDKDIKAKHILNALKCSWIKPDQNASDYIRPYHRFLIGAILRLLPYGERHESTGQPYWNPTEPPRGDVVPADRDPLRLLLNLRINRFLTTNYDQEVEKLFRSEGLIHKTEPTAQQADDADEQSAHHQLGHSWRDLVFDKKHVGRMLAFAAADGRKLAEVVHLHGRAVKAGEADKTSEITVTTEDYQRRYITADDRRPGMEDALSAAFGGNPVLFVGSGMGEDDLLRPLRQFVGETGINPDRLSVALVPAKNDDARSHMEKINNLQQYGVYTVHYGRAKAEAPLPPVCPTPNALPARPESSRLWLAGLEQLRKKLEGMFQAAAELLADQEKSEQPEESAETPNPEAAFPTADLRQAWKGIENQICKKSDSFDVTEALSMIESIEVSAHPALQVKTEIVIFKLAVDLAAEISEMPEFKLSEWKQNDGESLLRRLGCLRFALTGAMDSITGAFLCAMLIKLDRDAQKWGSRWLQLPQPEDPAENVRDAIRSLSDDQERSGLLWQRHAVYLAESPSNSRGDDLESYRFYSNAPSQTFNHLRASLDEPEIKAILASPPRARRIFLFATKRGVGKGHYFAALTNPSHLEQLCLAIGQPPKGSKWAAAFFNFSFSHETSSIFDQITEFLVCAADRTLSDLEQKAKNNPVTEIAMAPKLRRWRSDIKKMAEDMANLSCDRLGRLEQALRSLSKTTLFSADRRILVALSGLSMLYDREGHPKNAQAGRLINLLIGNASRGAPIDLLIFAGESWIPRAFRNVGGEGQSDDEIAINLVEIKRSQVTPKRERALERRRAVLRIQPASAMSEDTSPRNQAFVHFLYGTRASVMMAAFFPSVALAIGLYVRHKVRDLSGIKLKSAIDNGDTGTKFGKLTKCQFSEEADFAIRNKINILLQSGNQTEANGRIENPKKYFPRIIAFAAHASALGRVWHGEFNWKWNESGDGKSKEQLTKSRELAREIDFWFRDLYIACGESRFAFTVLTATAYQYLLPVTVRIERDITPSMIADAIEECVNFLKRVRFELEGRPTAERRSAAIIDTALRTIAELDAQVNRSLPGKLSFLRSGPGLSQLQEVILWQLAVIGQPVTRDVLVHSPLVVQCCKIHRDHWVSRTPDICPWPDSGVVDQAVGDCLRLLEQRCLVFRLRPRVPAAQTSLANPKYRYAVHRIVQRHVFVNLQAPFIEYSEADQFAITLFASQPKDVPRLTAHAYQDLRRTVAALIGFPDVGDCADDLACWATLPQRPKAGSDKDYAASLGPAISQHSQMLRAALGMVRSIFSLAIISRTDLPPGLGLPANAARRSPTVTVLEELRLLLLWMLQQAKTIDDQIKYVKKYSKLTPVQRPFYAEEIAWLYNECGVISLTQGRIIDAGHLFVRADKAAERFEPYPDGSTRTRIALNKALADIYRGRLQEAQDALARVQNLTDEHPAILCIARGLLGQVDHIRGRYTSAEEHYKRALMDGEKGHKGLISLNKSRAASIFCRYYGDLFRAREEFKEAEAMLRQAMILAIEGGHEDVRHQAQLATVHLEIVRNETNPEPKTLLDGSRLHRELDFIEEYARSMGMLQLRCATDLIRSDLHRYGGDLKGAASVASRGLTLAETHDMRLRKTRFLLRLADIYERQGQPDQGGPLVEAAFDLARETGYHAAREQGQKLLARIRAFRGVTL